MKRTENTNELILDKSDIESAIRQFICACYPEYSAGYIIDPVVMEQEVKVYPYAHIKVTISEHSNSSQLCTGTYANGVTKEQVEQRCKGSFGGRFQSFGDGKFSYIAHTD